MRRWGLTPPQWRDLPEVDREEMLAEEELVCPDCGNLTADCSDPTKVQYPQRRICYNRATVELALRRLSRGHVEPGWNAHPMDGVSVYATDVDLNPEDDFIPKAERKNRA